MKYAVPLKWFGLGISVFLAGWAGGSLRFRTSPPGRVVELDAAAAGLSGDSPTENSSRPGLPPWPGPPLTDEEKEAGLLVEMLRGGMGSVARGQELLASLTDRNARRLARRRLGLSAPRRLLELLDDPDSQYLEETGSWIFQRDTRAGLELLGSLPDRVWCTSAHTLLWNLRPRDFPLVRSWMEALPRGARRAFTARILANRMLALDPETACGLLCGEGVAHSPSADSALREIADLWQRDMVPMSTEEVISRLPEEMRPRLRQLLGVRRMWKMPAGQAMEQIFKGVAGSREEEKVLETEWNGILHSQLPALARSDGRRAEEFYRRLPERFRSETVCRNLFSAWAGGADAASAAEAVNAMPPGEEREWAAESLAEALADRAPEEALPWVASLSSKEKRLSLLRNTLNQMPGSRLPELRPVWESLALTPEERMLSPFPPAD